MIVSSSASIGRRLNISTSLSSSSTTSAEGVTKNRSNLSRTGSGGANRPPTIEETTVCTAPSSSSELESRMANYKHPVIQFDKPQVSSRPPSALARNRCDSGGDTTASNVSTNSIVSSKPDNDNPLDIGSEQNSGAYLEAGDSELSGPGDSVVIHPPGSVSNNMVARLNQATDLTNRR